MIRWLDLGANTLFAFEGALIAAAVGFDLLGVLVVAAVSALGGGILRDVLIGDVPPEAFSRARYVTVSAIGGVVAFAAYEVADSIPQALLVTLDAGGLSLFAVAGSLKALDRRLIPLMAVLMGGLTAVGGGVMRDILVGGVPRVLVGDVYATAALAGAAVVVVGLRYGWSRPIVLGAGAATCFAARMVAWWQDWELPVVG
ncbi:MAG: TRIC cation channel family protein [Acidimicrobiia bacterium]|nr:TRIC cation channel family protein [Acidimicrobiia bacterium]